MEKGFGILAVYEAAGYTPNQTIEVVINSGHNKNSIIRLV